MRVIGYPSRSCAAAQRVALGIALLVAAVTCNPSQNRSPRESPEKAPVRASIVSELVTSFGAGSLVIPMDTTYQNSGMLKAYGLVYRLLLQGVTVHWAILSGKAQGGVDFTASGTNLQTGAPITDHGYRGGPFIIAAADRSAALPIINAWHQAGNVTTVHSMTASFTADIARTLTSAPKIAVFADGNEIIAFDNLNAAGIPDSTGQPWPTSADTSRVYTGFPDVLNTAEVSGPTTTGAGDGALFNTDGTPAYCHVTSMHYSITPDDEVVREVRQWLNYGPITHAYMQCLAITVFENATSGLFLTTGGLRDDGGTPNPLRLWTPANPFAQYDGPLSGDGGTINSIGLVPGSTFKPNVSVMIEEDRSQSSPNQIQMMWVAGNLDGDTSKGRVTYLAGHNFSTNLPITSDSQTNGVRLFLNSFFESNCATAAVEPTLTLTKSAPALVNGSTITFTIDYSNTGPGVAGNAMLTDPLPMGTTFVSATGGGSHTGGVVTWDLGNLAAGASGQVSVTVSVSSDGSYANQATLSYRVGQTPKQRLSNTTTTVRDTVPPDTTITAAPTDPSASADATFQFTGSESPVTFQCKLDAGVFAACTSPRAYSGLADGSHTFQVRAIDAAGNVDPTPATHTWSIDTAPPDTTISAAPPNPSSSASATFQFSSNESPVTFACKLDAGAFTTCTSPQTYTGLADGSHTFQVRATDAAGNVDATPATHTWTVDTAPPETTIESAPPLFTANTSATFDFSSNETGATFECKLDAAAAFTACSDPVTFTALAEGGHTLSVRARDLAGNVDATPASHAWTVDTQVPSAPVIVSPADGSFTNDSTPPVTGTAEALATVRVFLGGVLAGTTTADADGNWSFQLGTLADGTYQLRAQTVDRAGNPSGFSAITTFTVDTGLPAAPVVVTPVDGSSTNDTTPLVTGTAEAFATVTVLFDNGSVGTAPTDGSGNWTFTPTVPLTAGAHTVAATATDRAGNPSGQSGVNNFVVDVTAPEPPTITAPTEGQFLSTSQPTITGTAEAGATVEVRTDTSVVGTVTADSNGDWTYTLTAPQALADGGHNAQARATDAAGNQSALTSPRNFTVDTQAPAAPIVTSPAAGSRTNDTTPTVTGTSEANASVQVSIDSGAVGTVVADGSGNWSYTLTVAQALPAGDHTVGAQATDQAGNSGPASTPHGFTVDITPPAPPVITAPPNNTATSDNTPTVVGTAEPLSTVQVLVGGSPAGTTTADASGNWSLTLGTLADGTYLLTAVATDQAGNTSSPSATTTITVDTDPPAAPVVQQPTDGSVTNDNTPTVSGTAEAGATVAVLVDGVERANAVVAGDGNWQVTLTTPLADGTYTITATATDGAGNTSGPSAAVSFTVDTVAPQAPFVVNPANGTRTNDSTPPANGTAEGLADVIVFIDGSEVATATANGAGAWSLDLPTLADGAHQIQVQARDRAGNVGGLSNLNSFVVDTQAPATPVVVTPAHGSFVATTTPQVTGTAEAGATVTVLVDGSGIGTTVADGNGAWSLAVPTALSEATHTVAAFATDSAGNVSGTSGANSFTVDVTAPPLPTITAPAAGALVATVRPTITGGAEVGATVEIRVDGAVVGSVVATDGTWTYSLTEAQALTEGDHNVQARATDAAGNASALTDPSSFTVDTQPPAAPVVATPAAGSRTNDTTPTVAGTAEPSSTVAVIMDGQTVGNVVASASGAFSYTLTAGQALSAGDHTVSAQATDPAGNTGPASVPNAFVVDEDPPAPPVITSPADGAVTSDATPGVTGTAEALATVDVLVNGTQRATTTASAAGDWSLTLPALADGTYTLTARATDQAGNPGQLSSAVGITIDTAVPAAPSITQPTDGATIGTGTPVVAGTAEAGSTVTVRDGAVVLGTASVDGAGNWTFPVPGGAALADGPHQLTATATDAAGNTGSPSNAVNIVVDTGVPAAPVITSPTHGATIGQPQPTISGTAEIGTTVTVFLGGSPVGTVVAGEGGLWSLTVPSALADGTYVATATSTDGAGNTSPVSAGVTFTVDTAAPGTTRIDSPADNARINDPTPDVVGVADPGSRVEISVGGTVVGQTIATAQGDWTFTVGDSDALAEGPHVLTAQSFDGANNPGPVSDPVHIVVDLTAPAAPVITSPVEGARTNDTTPTITGTAVAGEQVDVYFDGAFAGSAFAGQNGQWSFTSVVPLTEGGHFVFARARDAAGNVGPDSTTVSFIVDVSAPTPPTIIAPANGSSINETRPAISGTAEASSTVTVTLDGQTVGNVVASISGTWTYTLTQAQALVEGTYVARATAVDQAGNPSGISAPSTFIVDLTDPDAPIITLPAEDAFVGTGQPTIVGTAEPLSTVTVTLDGLTVGNVVASASGTWSYTLTPPQALDEGAHQATAVSTDIAGNGSLPSAPRNFTVDTTSPSKPTILLPSEGAVLAGGRPTIAGEAEPGSIVSVIVDGSPVGQVPTDGGGTWTYTLSAGQALADGAHAATAVSVDAAGNASETSDVRSFTVDSGAPAAPVITSPTDGTRTNNPRPPVSGTAEPGVTVTVFLDGSALGNVTATSGGWSLTPPTDIGEGEHLLTASSVDAAGNTSATSAPVRLVIDLTAPNPPTITAPPDGTQTNDPTPTVAGTAEPGATVEIFFDGVSQGNTVASASGGWTFTSPESSGLAEGSHVITAVATDPAGNSGQASAGVGVTIDVTAPAAPIITEPMAGALLGGVTPTITGTAEAGSQVEVRVDGSLVGVVVANAQGGWTYTLTPAQSLSEGNHQATATARDPAGNVSPQSEPVDFIIDVTAPAAPTISAPTNDSRTREQRPAFSGTGAADTSLTLLLDGQSFGTTTVDSQGAWTYTPTEAQALAEGTYVARAHTTDGAGNQSPNSAPVTFTVDLTAPGIPVITAPAEDAVVGTGRPTITGTAEAGATVQVAVDGNLVGTVAAGPDDAWVYTLAAGQALSDGNHTATASATDPVGNTSQVTAPRSFIVDTTAPGRPTITSPSDGGLINTGTPAVGGTAEPGARVTVSVDGIVRGQVVADGSGQWTYTLTPGQALGDGSHTASAIASDGAGNPSGQSDPVGFTVDTQAPPAPVILAPSDGTRTNQQQPPVNGTAEPGSTVQVFIDGVPVGTVNVAPDGTWTFTPTQAIPEGTHGITARATDPAGNASGISPTVTLVVDITGPAAPVITSPVNGGRTNNPTPTITGTTEPGATVEVFVDGTLLGTAVADGGGAWRYAPTAGQRLDNGDHTVTARATDTVGNAGPASSPNTFTVDSVVPAAPVITSPLDGARLRDRAPQIDGTAEPGAIVFVFVDGIQLGVVTAGPDGRWSYVLTTAQELSDGEHVTTARAVDSAGNPSALSAPVTFTVDLTAPLAPVISSPTSGDEVGTGSPTVSGTAEPGTEIEVFLDGTSAGTAVTGEDGSWTVTPNQTLPDGSHQITATARDDTGNVSDPSAPVDIVVDTTPPAPPVVQVPADGSQVNDSNPDIGGTAEPRSTVEVYVDGQLVGITSANEDGLWSLATPTPLEDGEHTVSARATDPAGNQGPLSPANRFTVDTVAPEPPTLVQPPALTNDPTPTVSGTTEPGATVEVSVDGEVVGTTIAGDDGSWSLAIPSDVSDGDHTVTGVAIDPAGNRSEPTDRSVAVDTVPPAAPVILDPVNGRVYLEIPPGHARGTAVPRLRVRVFLDGVEQPELRAGDDGSWQLPLGTLGDGAHTLIAAAIDEAGNISPQSNQVVFYVGFREPNPFKVVGGGCACSTADRGQAGLGLLWLLLAGLVLAVRRRRRPGAR